jgi:hypothetical protein
MNQDTIAFIRQRGLFLEKDLFDLLTSFSDAEIAKNLLNNLEKVSGQKMITSSSLTKNAEYVLNVVKSLPGSVRIASGLEVGSIETSDSLILFAIIIVLRRKEKLS